MLTHVVATVVLLTTSAAAPADLHAAIAAARKAASAQRYSDVITILEPYTEPLPAADDDRFNVAAEFGRALFHLAQYDLAYDWILRAAALQPHNIEVGIYRQASAFITGRHEEAFALFEQVLRSGAQDLWLPISLSGTTQFLEQERTQQLLQQYARLLPIDLRRGRIAGAALGMARTDVKAALGALTADDGRFLLARAGPVMLWSLEFDQSDRLVGAVVNVAGMLRFSSLRPSFEQGLDWRATPGALTSTLGPPIRQDDDQNGQLSLEWQRDTISLLITFAPATQPTPPGVGSHSQLIQSVRLQLTDEVTS